MTKSLTVLRSVVVIDASAIAMYGIGTGLDPDGSISLAVAIVAAMALQILLVFRRPRRAEQPPAPPSPASSQPPER